MADSAQANERPSRRRRTAVRLMIYFAVAVVVYLLIVLAIQRRVLFPRHVIVTPPAALAVPRGVERLERPIPGGVVEAWFIPSALARPGRPGPAVIFAHGNAELIDHNLDLAREYNSYGLSVLMPEYRGYGRSDGSPSQAAIVEDFVAWYDRLAAREDVDPERIVLHGRSLGGAVAAQVAAQRPVRGLILESTFTSVKAMAWQFLVPPILVRDPFDTLALAGELNMPVLIMHGTTDRVVPPAHADQLHTAIPGSTRVHFDGGHNDPVPAEAYWAAITALLRDAQAMPHRTGGGHGP